MDGWRERALVRFVISFKRHESASSGLFPARAPGTALAFVASVLARALVSTAAALEVDVFLKRHSMVLVFLDRKVGHVVRALKCVALRQRLCLPAAPVLLVSRQPAAHQRISLLLSILQSPSPASLNHYSHTLCNDVLSINAAKCHQHSDRRRGENPGKQIQKTRAGACTLFFFNPWRSWPVERTEYRRRLVNARVRLCVCGLHVSACERQRPTFLQIL